MGPIFPHQRSHRRAGGRWRLAAALVVVLALPVSGLAQAQETPAPTTPPETTVKGATPRSAMLAYLEAARANDYTQAAGYLDLRTVPPAQRATQGPLLAQELKTVLDRKLWVEIDQLSDAPEGEADDGLPSRQDLVGTIDTAKGSIPILVERVRAESGWTWKIASATVARIPALYKQFGYGRLGEYLPKAFFEIQFLEMQLWQWIGLLVLILVAVIVAGIATAIIKRIVRPLVARSKTLEDDRLLALSTGPLRLLIAATVFAAGIYLLALSVPVQTFLVALQKALVIIAGTWLLVRVAALAAVVVEDSLVRRGQTMALSVVPLGKRTLQVLVVAAGVLAALQNFGVNVTGILAGLGIGGLAVALAAQKTVENLFGGVTLIMDQPVRVGDFCRFDGKVGTIEEVGLRSTRIRTLDRTVISIPNGAFSAMQLENFSKRDRIWFHPTIGLRYETTPDQMRYILIELKKMLLGHPKVDPDPARPRFSNFNAYSLDVDIFAYIKTSDYGEYLAIQEDLFLRIMDIVEASGSGFAFPSQTIYTGKDDGLDEDKVHAAEEQVRAWRESNSLGLPDFPRQEIVKLTGTLDYPPKGSALRPEP